MCRMFAYVGSSPAELEALYNALKKASACDACLQAMVRENNPAHDGWHKHGWGYVLRTNDQIFHYRTAQPVDRDNHPLPAFTGPVQAVFHARLSTGVIGDAAFSHPFCAATNESVFYFAHNGGLKNSAVVVPNKVDSEWALDQIVKESTLGTALPKLKENTLSALNLLLLTINRESRQAVIQYLNWYNGYGDAQKDGYYRMYQATMAGGGRAVFSSTMEEHLLSHITKGSNRPVEYGEVLTLV